MLKFICEYILRAESSKDREDIKGFMSNLVADLYSDNILGRRRN